MRLSWKTFAGLGKAYAREELREAVYAEADKVKAELKAGSVPPSIIVDRLANRIWSRLDKML